MNTDIQRTKLEEKAAAGDTMAIAESTALALGIKKLLMKDKRYMDDLIGDMLDSEGKEDTPENRADALKRASGQYLTDIAREMVQSRLNEAVEFSKQQKLDMNRLWDDYDGKDLSKEELTEMLGNDLEMLEYNPKEIEQMLKILVILIHEKRLKGKPFISDELDDY